MLALFRIYVNPCIPGGIRVKTLQNLICLSSKHLGVLKNLFKHVCAFQIDLQVLFFEEKGKPEYPEKNLSENRGEPNKKFRTKVIVGLSLVVDKTQLIP